MANDMTPMRPSPGGFPPLDLTRFLEGRTTAHGIFEDRFGRVRRSFTVEIDGAWNGSDFVLNEAFRYDDGMRETRAWRLTPVRDGRFTATCTDCIGTAQGESMPGATRLRYKFRLALGKRALVVDFDDRVIQMGDHLAINRATVRKWGMKLGEVFIVFQRGGETRPAKERQRELADAAA
jgi:hypothetical protein